ncbi:MAG: hypothetical protein OEX22_09305 [Cyclobacteriaceae bacterium]|nr:hypothetical protein [Cyclobacteriaceae bacterium]
MNWLEKLKDKWGISSNIQIVLIFIVFAINGSFAAWVAKPITEFVGVTSDTAKWIYYPVRILLVFPIYQFTLPLVGFVFGQFKFFWEFEKKMFSRFRRNPK